MSDDRTIEPLQQGPSQALDKPGQVRRRLERQTRLGEHQRGKRGRSTADVYELSWADAASFYRGYWEEGSLASWADPQRHLTKGDRRDLTSWLMERLHRLEVEDVEAYVKAMQEKPLVGRDGRQKIGLEPATINSRLAALAYLVNDALPKADNPVEKVPRLKKERKFRPHALQLEQVRDVLGAIDVSTAVGIRDYMLMKHLIMTGRRREETALTLVQDITLHPEIPGRYVIHTIRKGGKYQVLPLTEEHAAELLDYLGKLGLGDIPRAAVFPIIKKGNRVVAERPIGPEDVTRIVRERTKAVLGKARSPHAWRATFATVARAGGASKLAIQEYMGHSSSETTDLYFDGVMDLNQSAAEFVRRGLGGEVANDERT